jgi:excisionase family DNA binding protein
VIVHFGYDPALDVVAGTDKERRGKRREMRRLLRRAQREGNLSAQAICIDAHTSQPQIVEQLAVLLAQRGISDPSTERLLGLHHYDDVTRTAAIQLIRDFVDPLYPASFAAYKRTLRFRVVGPEEATCGLEDEHGPVDEEITDEVRRKMRSPKRKERGPDYGAREAARILGVPKRTLYNWISKGKLHTHQDNLGRCQISARVLEELQQEKKKKEEDLENRKGLTLFVASRYGIQTASARRRISRALKEGKTMKEIYLEAKSHQA